MIWFQLIFVWDNQDQYCTFQVWTSFLQLCLTFGDSSYRTFYFDDICPTDYSKREIDLKTGAAIFKFDERNLKTKVLLQERDISCHIELETENGKISDFQHILLRLIFRPIFYSVFHIISTIIYWIRNINHIFRVGARQEQKVG